MNFLKKLLSVMLVLVMSLVSIAGCSSSASSTPESTPEPTPTATATPTPTPVPTPTPEVIPADAYFIVQDGEAAATFVYAEKETQMIRDAVAEIRAMLEDECGFKIPVWEDNKLSRVKTDNVFYVGMTKRTELSRMGQATSYQYIAEKEGNNVYLLSYTQGGIREAVESIRDNIIVTSDGKNAYVTPDVFGLKDRQLAEVDHAWDRFTISGYGTPTFSTYDPDLWNEKDQETFQSIIDFGVSTITVWESGYRTNANFDLEALKKYIDKFYSVGITTRLYAFSNEHYQKKDHEGYPTGVTKDYAALEDCIKHAVETFGDIEGIEQWGFYDEPLSDETFSYCRDVMDLFDKYDTKDRPVYINMGPLTGQIWVEDPLHRYNQLLNITNPDYYCFDRYPFWCVDENGDIAFGGEPIMYEEYWYSNLEINRNIAIDASRDAGMIIACIIVGGEAGRLEGRADISQEFMNWQMNLALAYGYKYVEQFVFYTGHDYGLYTKDNEKTHRWYIAKNANDYANVVGAMLFDKKLDIVYHLANADGSYSPEVVPYTGYGDIGNVIGCDAVLSFFEDSTIIVTDKRCCDNDGGEHDVTLTGIKGGVEWFNAETGEWEDISTCQNASVGDNGLMLTMTRASQFIIRTK